VGTVTRFTHSEWREQAAAYALGALARDERLDFEAHLLECSECEDEARSFASVATALAAAAPPIMPDRRLRSRALEVDVRQARPPRAPRRLAPWLVAAASLALAAGLGLQLFRMGREAGRTQSARTVLGAEDMVRVDLSGQPVAPRAFARAFWSRSRGLIVTASRLPPLPAGRTYQIWIIAGGKPIGAGLLKPDADGAVEAVFATIPGDYATTAAFAVTLEPEGGVPAPTGDKYLVGLVK
jgi:anti-sigma-K factor RskA